MVGVPKATVGGGKEQRITIPVTLTAVEDGPEKAWVTVLRRDNRLLPEEMGARCDSACTVKKLLEAVKVGIKRGLIGKESARDWKPQLDDLLAGPYADDMTKFAMKGLAEGNAESQNEVSVERNCDEKGKKKTLVVTVTKREGLKWASNSQTCEWSGPGASRSCRPVCPGARHLPHAPRAPAPRPDASRPDKLPGTTPRSICWVRSSRANRSSWDSTCRSAWHAAHSTPCRTLPQPRRAAGAAGGLRHRSGEGARDQSVCQGPIQGHAVPLQCDVRRVPAWLWQAAAGGMFHMWCPVSVARTLLMTPHATVQILKYLSCSVVRGHENSRSRSCSP